MHLALSYIQGFHTLNSLSNLLFYLIWNFRISKGNNFKRKEICFIYTLLPWNNRLKYRKKDDNLSKSSYLNSHDCNIK